MMAESGKTSLSKDYDVLNIIAARTQTVIQGKRKVLIEQDLHETCFTAGGKCAATCAA